mgnify:FL=1
MNQIGVSNIFSDVKFFEGKIFEDDRGIFRKPFYGTPIEEIFGNDFEVIISSSGKNVIRGLHFQNPPHDVDKFIYCLNGSIKDVFVDLRKKSSTFGKFDSIHLNEKNPVSVLVPKGFAHGFSVLSEKATVIYLQSGKFNEVSDYGISYKSLNIDWEVENPIVSDKDSNLPDFKEFSSPWE